MKLGEIQRNVILKDTEKRGKERCWAPDDSCCKRQTGDCVRMREVKQGKRQQLGETEECGVTIRGMTGDKEQREQDKRIRRQRRTNRSSSLSK